MAKSEFQYRCMISIDGAEPIPWESMTPDQEADVRRRMSERLSRSMSDYYSIHPEEYRKYCETTKAKENVHVQKENEGNQTPAHSAARIGRAVEGETGRA